MNSANPPTDNGMAWISTATVLSTSVVFAIASQTGVIRTWLNTLLLRYFGAGSYGLHLMHAVVCIRLLKLVAGPGAGGQAVHLKSPRLTGAVQHHSETFSGCYNRRQVGAALIYVDL
jgi:hypothetical protein